MTICRGLAKPNRGDSEAGRSPHRSVLSESANCESLSQKSKIFASSLWQGSRGQCPLTMRTGIFCESLLPLQRPVSLLRCSRCIDQSPPCQRGVPRHRRGGGIPQAGKFPHRLVLLESACCESLSHGCAVPATFSKGAFGCGIDTGRVREVTITDQPGAKLSAAARRKAPLSKGAGKNL